jgi:hypothetical protein
MGAGGFLELIEQRATLPGATVRAIQPRFAHFSKGMVSVGTPMGSEMFIHERAEASVAKASVHVGTLMELPCPA